MTKSHFDKAASAPQGRESETREMLYDGREYVMYSKQGWIDVRNMTVCIVKDKEGLRVEIWPLEHNGITEPLAVSYVEWSKVPDDSMPRIRFKKGNRR
jgi:hypothetical protein